jgi:hypothetical protein
MVTVVRYRWIGALCGVAFLLIAGCEQSVSLIPNNDPSLRKPTAQFSADASKRAYEADAPKTASDDFRAGYALTYRRVEMANISDEDYSNIEVWINGKYVVYCNKFEKKSGKSLPFRDFFDGQGHRFDTADGNNAIQTIEVYADGNMHQVKSHVEDLR